MEKNIKKRVCWLAAVLDLTVIHRALIKGVNLCLTMHKILSRLYKQKNMRSNWPLHRLPFRLRAACCSGDLSHRWRTGRNWHWR